MDVAAELVTRQRSSWIHQDGRQTALVWTGTDPGQPDG